MVDNTGRKTGADARHAAAEYTDGLVAAKLAVAELEGAGIYNGGAREAFAAVQKRLNEMIRAVDQRN
jgi:hypothetical protein